jgi:hypothetical protein
MNAKEALLMLRLGAVIKRASWREEAAAVALDHDGKIFIRFTDGHTMRDTVESFLAQKWTDWEVYCPQDNK